VNHFGQLSEKQHQRAAHIDDVNSDILAIEQ
jgi:hypothetical protein